MQVGPAITPLPEEALTLDLKEYAARPITFLRKHLADHGAIATQSFLERVQFYPFISDLFGEWLQRNSNIAEASHFLTTITREIIGNMTLSDLCAMLQSPLALLAIDGAQVDTRTVSSILREFYLSSLAQKIEQHGSRIDPTQLEQVLANSSPAPAAVESAAAPSAVAPSAVAPSAVASANATGAPEEVTKYSDFLSELKDAGVIIPPSSQSRKYEAPLKPMTIASERSATSRVSKLKAPSTKAPSRGVESLLSPDAHEKIMLKIFRNDEDDYRRSMELINKAKDWKQASIYLDALFMRRKVDPYSKTATRLTDAVYARFNLVR